MSSDWPKVKLADYCDKIGSGATPRGGSKVYLDSGEISLVRSQNVYNHGFDYDGLVYIDEKAAEKLSNVELEENDVLINITGDSVARVCMVPDDVLPARVNQHVSILRPKNDSLDPRFLRYSLVNYENQYKLLAIASAGGTRKAITKGHLEEFEISLPDITYQKEVSEILSTFDQKIHLNQQTNETLEAMAQAIFKSWFVDFDPVRAKMKAKEDGRDPKRAAMAAIVGVSLEEDWYSVEAALNQKLERMSVEQREQLEKIAGLFPETLEESEIGEVPNGWKVTDLTKCLDRISITYNLKETEEVIFLNTGDIEQGKFLHENYSKTDGLPGQAKKSIQKGDILYSEIRPKNKRFAYVYFDSSDYVVSTKLMVLRTKNSIDSLFYYQILKSESTINELQFLAESRSGTFPQITFDSLKAIKFILPHQKEIIDHFIKVLRTNFERLIQNQKQNETLAQLRDTLLPKLISGEVEV